MSPPSVAAVEPSGRVTARAPGFFDVLAEVAGVQGLAEVQVLAPARAVDHESIDPFLAEPAPGHLHEIPVLVLRYLPTADGSTLDVSWDPDFYVLDPQPLDALQARIDGFDRHVKFMLEEGSRFRGYARPLAPPSLGYRVVEYLTVFEPTPPGQPIGEPYQGLVSFQPDFEAIFERFDVEELVNECGVREIWLWSGGLHPSFPSYDPALHTPDRLRGNWESNLSSPVTGDISNSDRDPTDLPLYEHAYIVYGSNFRRTQAEAVHNHGHQLEAMLSHANQLQDGDTELFWQRFVGRDASFQWLPGRCGDTHHPPNARSDYDYLNPALVESDIFDWNPAGTGRRTLVNADSWGNLPYAWPGAPPREQLVESQWYLLWMQSLPGHANGIPHGTDVLTDWWEFTADWDASIEAGVGLHAQPVTSPEDALVPGDYDTIGAALQDATDRNGNGWIEIQVLPGTYRENPRIRRSHVRLMGQARQATIIVGNGRDDVVRVAPPSGASALQEVHVSGFTLTGGGSGGEGVEFSRVDAGGITDCIATGCHEGILVQDSSGVTVYGNLVHGNRGTGIRIARSRGPSSVDNVVRENGGQGIHYDRVAEELPGLDTRFEHNEASENGENGLLLVRTDGFLVRDCLLEGNGESGIRLKETRALRLLQSVARENRVDGLRLEGTRGSLVSDNTFTDNGAFGIRLREGSSDDFSEAPGLQGPVGTNLVSGNHAGNSSPETHVIDFSSHAPGPMEGDFFEGQGVVFRAADLFVADVQGDEALVTDFEGRFSRPVVALSVRVAPGFLGKYEYRLTARERSGQVIASLVVSHAQPPGSGYFDLDLGTLPREARSFDLEVSRYQGAGASAITFVTR